MIVRLISMILVVLWLGGFPVYALTHPDPDSPQEKGPYIICAESDLSNFASWPYVKSVIILEPNETIHILEEEGALINALPLQMAYVCESGTTIDVDVVWDISDETLKQPGLHQVIGYPVIDGEMIFLAAGYDGKVTWPVFRKGGEPLEAFPLQKPLLPEPLIPLNNDLFELNISTSGRSWGVGSDGIIKSDDSWVWTWDYTEIDISREGSYTITGTLEPPEWISADDADRICRHTVYVLPDDRIEIYAACEVLVTHSKGQISTGDLVIKWLYDSSNVTEAVLQYVDENGLWTDCDNNWYRYDPPSRFSPAKLRLRLLEIPAGAEHSLRLRYVDVVDSEPVERFTTPITLTIPENIIEILEDADGGIPAELDIGGDRDEDDFGDQGVEPPHGGMIPPPETPNETSPDTEDGSSADNIIKPLVDAPTNTDSEQPSDEPEDGFQDSITGDEVRPPDNMFTGTDFWWPIIHPEDDFGYWNNVLPHDEIVPPSEPSAEISPDTEDDTLADNTVEPPKDTAAETDSEQLSGDGLGEQSTELPHNDIVPPSEPQTEMPPNAEDDASEDSTVEPPKDTAAETDNEQLSGDDFGEQSTELPGDTSADINFEQLTGDPEDDLGEHEAKQAETSDTSETPTDHSFTETNSFHNNDESVTEFTGESEPFQVLDTIILIVGLSVFGSILCILLLYRKKEKK